MTRIRIHGGRVVDPAEGRDEVTDVVIVDGRVDGFIGQEAGGEFDRTIDAAGLVVAPGFVDLHCHLREPGFEDKETIATGALAAAAGGFTTVCCMPNTNPTLDTANDIAFVYARAQAAHGARVLPLGTITRGQQGRELSDASELAGAGVVGFSDDGRPVWDGRLMRYALMESLRHKKPIVNHCEDPEIADGGVMNQGRVADLLGLKGQPATAEDVMVARDIELARETGGRLHLAHISTEGSVALLRMAKRDGLDVTAEVTPHHLTMTDAWVLGQRNGKASGRPYDTATKVNPPLRGESDRQALVAALAEGLIDVIATDHAPHRSIDKDCTYDEAAFGISGFETALGCLTRLVDDGQLTMLDVIRRLTWEPCRIFNLPYGRITPGLPADIVLFDPRAQWTVDAARFHSKGKNTPLDGETLRGAVVATLVGGDVVYERGTV
ncbi:MAG TPA: dihydroorotase [Chloroflexota bacterium]|nr:dihydroorotase [Chloroflexota bacterium]